MVWPHKLGKNTEVAIVYDEGWLFTSEQTRTTQRKCVWGGGGEGQHTSQNLFLVIS